MRENVIVAYRGANFELGQWPYGYGIWRAADQEPLPLEWWDPTPEGWSAAWYRFATLEVPGTITPVSHGAAEAAGPAGGAAATAAPATSPGPAGTVAMAPATPPGQGTDAPPASAQRPAPFFGPAGQHPGYPAPAQQSPGYQSPAYQVPAGAVPAGAVPAGAVPAGAVPAGAVPAGTVPAGTVPAHPAPLSNAATTTAPLSRGRATLAAALIAAGVVLGVIGLFPSYSGSSLASQAATLWPHLIYLAGWAAGAALIFRGGKLQRTGALIAIGLSVVTFGLFLADAGFPIADGSSLLGAGLVLSLIGWAACAAGSVVAFGRWPADWPRRRLGPDAGVIAALIVAAIGVAATFAPAWDKITLPTGTGVSLSETLGNAFSNPGAVIVGDVAVMLGLVAVVVVAVLWRPARLGWALIAGAMIPMTAQIVSALAQLGQTTTAAQLGVSPAQAAQLQISTSQVAHTSLTAAFWLYCVFVIVLLIGCAWLAFGGEDTVHASRFGYGRRAAAGVPQSSGQGSWPGTPAGYAAPAGYPAAAGYPAPAGQSPQQAQPATPAPSPSPAPSPAPAPAPGPGQVPLGQPNGPDVAGPAGT